MFCIFDIKQDCCYQYRSICKMSHQIPLMCSAYSVGCASSIISIIRSSSIAAADGIADSCCRVFYNIVVDPLSSCHPKPEFFENCNNNRKQHGNLSDDIPCCGIPGRHNGREARKKCWARPPPFQRSCIRWIRPSTKPKIKETVDPVQRIVCKSFVQAYTDCFQEWKNLLQLCITSNCKIQECVFGIFDYYFFVIPLILLSIIRRGSVVNSFEGTGAYVRHIF